VEAQAYRKDLEPVIALQQKILDKHAAFTKEHDEDKDGTLNGEEYGKAAA